MIKVGDIFYNICNKQLQFEIGEINHKILEENNINSVVRYRIYEKNTTSQLYSMRLTYLVGEIEAGKFRLINGD